MKRDGYENTRRDLHAIGYLDRNGFCDFDGKMHLQKLPNDERRSCLFAHPAARLAAQKAPATSFCQEPSRAARRTRWFPWWASLDTQLAAQRSHLCGGRRRGRRVGEQRVRMCSAQQSVFLRFCHQRDDCALQLHSQQSASCRASCTAQLSTSVRRDDEATVFSPAHREP